MTIFYRGPCVRITHEVFEVWCPTHRLFALPGLSHVQVLERDVDPAPAVRSARAGSTGLAGAIALAVALSWADGGQALASPAVGTVLVALLVVSMAASGACWRVPTVERELVAVYRGRPVPLFHSADPRTFGQVRRGLLRALERLQEPR